MHTTILTLLSLSALIGSTVAWAVGDLPVRMTKKQVTTYYRSIRPVLNADDATCPMNQRPVSGLVTGGSSPQGGRQQIVLTFDKGAKVTVSRSWDRTAQGMPMKVQIDCSL